VKAHHRPPKDFRCHWKISITAGKKTNTNRKRNDGSIMFRFRRVEKDYRHMYDHYRHFLKAVAAGDDLPVGVFPLPPMMICPI
jgi:hypothetical protein